MTTSELARLAGVPIRTVQRACRTGALAGAQAPGTPENPYRDWRVEATPENIDLLQRERRGRPRKTRC